MTRDNTSPRLRVAAPAEFAESELREFEALVVEGGEVVADRLAARIRRASALLLMDDGFGLLNAIAALKHPADSYRAKLGRLTHVTLHSSEYPMELGWVFVSPGARGRGYSKMLVEAALARVQQAGLFATSRTDNKRMHAVLLGSGFTARAEYESGRTRQRLTLFTKDAAT
jgi:GNAT superfamily N-acetyltransferase